MKKLILALLCAFLIVVPVSCFSSEDWDGTYDNSYIYVANSYVNVRSQPNTNSKIVGALTKNMIVPGGQPSGSWIPINYNGYVRYVYSPYMRQTAKPISKSSKTYIGTCRTTGYDLCVKCCGKYPGSFGYGITASGTYALSGRTAAIKGYPYGTRLYIEGIGYRINEDTGGFGYNHVDIYCNNHSACASVTGYKGVYILR